MSQKNNPKKYEHFIPQLYLKFFSPDGNMVYQYRVKSHSPSKLVPIKTICYKKHLYELKNDNNEFICRNMIENTFEKYEGEFANVIRSIISKSKHESNYQIPCFLSTDEKMFLIFLVATTILRSPRLLKIAKDTVLDAAQKDGKNISVNTAHNSALLSCLPFVNVIEGRSDSILDRIIDKLMDMAFLIGVTNDDSFFTSDNPIFWHGNNETFDIEEVIFPLTPNIVLFMYPVDQMPRMFRNRVIHLTNIEVKDVNYRIILFCRDWLFSKKEIKNNQINVIEQIKEEQNVVL